MGTKEKKQQSQGSTKAAAKRATKQELLSQRITNKKLNLQKQPFIIRSVALAEENEQTLAHLKQTATDYTGRPISSSAILRALLRYAEQQPSFWIAKQIHPLLEEEIAQGRLWGTKSKKGKS